MKSRTKRTATSDSHIYAQEWQELRELRQRFLDGDAGEQNYWHSTRLLELYEQTFAQRIAWKWQYVLAELERLGWQLPDGLVLDWGCGTGVAVRTVLRTLQLPQPKVALYDRSALAVQFATEKIQKELPNATIVPFEAAMAFQGVVLLSHVITELSEAALTELLTRLQAATAILWVESGEQRASRKLITVRETLRAAFYLVAPCPHQASCGLLAKENKPHWCHHFAKPPTDAFTEKRWATFKAQIGIDLSDLPLSYLVLDKRPPPALPSNAGRLIGRARLYKGYAQLLICQKSGVAEYRLQERQQSEAYRQIRKEKLSTLLQLDVSERDILGLEPLP